MLRAEEFQDRLACIGSDVTRMEDPALLPVCYTPDILAELFPENKAVEYLRPVLRGVLPPAGGEILCASVHRILRQHLKLSPFPGIQTSFNYLPN